MFITTQNQKPTHRVFVKLCGYIYMQVKYLATSVVLLKFHCYIVAFKCDILGVEIWGLEA